MKLEIRFIGKTIVDMTCKTSESCITTDIAGVDGIVSDEFINELECIIYELKEHNTEKLNN